jgi:hypothetical protein
MQQIADWLKKLGLPECGERFAKNGIDVSVLPHLTDQDLKDMGVLLGHRRKMLAAIGGLSNQPAAAHAPETDPPIEPAPIPTAGAVAPPIAPTAEVAGERRYLTVMFCDLVDSTGIAARLDAEERRDLVNAYLEDASAAVMEVGGHVARKLGDGCLRCSAIRSRMRTTRFLANRCPRYRRENSLTATLTMMPAVRNLEF